MKKTIHTFLFLSLSVLIVSCSQGKADMEQSADENSPQVVKKRRDDGTLSSINPVDEDGYVHGVKVNFYEDGVTVHSKITYEHGRKHGPAIWFFKSGKIYEHAEFFQNRRNGITRRYYETGELYEEIPYESGEELPGKKRYNKAGEIISTD